ncbi:DoxX family protein [Ekhidna sp.]|uniref:DoxX family protein n=1 Tax=Ekhidna sp. TaxID=2608089 RepID=UPI003CCB92C3
MQTILLTAPVLCLAFLTILFLQSGLDKVFNYRGNKEWLSGHFENSPLEKMVAIMVPVITILEVFSGVFCGLGIIQIIFDGSTQLGLIGAQLSTVSILALFFGQRIAQDYAGAATLTTYFIICIITIYLLEEQNGFSGLF